MFGVSAGITPTESAPGYKAVNIAPNPHRNLGFSDASIETRYGTVRSYWRYEGEEIIYEFDIPSGVTANLTLPSGRAEKLAEGHYTFTEKL